MGGPSSAERDGERYHPWSTYIFAREEARRRGDRKVGTEHLLVALLTDPAVAGVLGSDAQRARSALEAMDDQALAAIGMEAVPAVPALAPADPKSIPPRPTLAKVLRGRLPLTPSAKRVLQASSKGMRRGRPHPGPEHVLAVLLELASPDPVADLLGTLGVEPGAVRERLAGA
jgi:hypothetical protein